jgi:hypothetical protein
MPPSVVMAVIRARCVKAVAVIRRIPVAVAVICRVAVAVPVIRWIPVAISVIGPRQRASDERATRGPLALRLAHSLPKATAKSD